VAIVYSGITNNQFVESMAVSTSLTIKTLDNIIIAIVKLMMHYNDV
jgi:hypothetical protein